MTEQSQWFENHKGRKYLLYKDGWFQCQIEISVQLSSCRRLMGTATGLSLTVDGAIRIARMHYDRIVNQTEKEES